MAPNKSIMGDYSLGELRDYFQTGKMKHDDAQRRSHFKKDGDMIDQMKDIKKEKHLMRLQKDSVSHFPIESDLTVIYFQDE